MTSGTIDKLDAAYRAHSAYVLGVLARRSPFIRSVDRQGVYHDAFALVLEKARAGRLDVDAMSSRQLRAYLAKTAVLIALDQLRWGERAHTRPLTESDLERANGEEPADERLAKGSELAVLREIVAELPERRQAIVKLRYFFDREPKEVQSLLGLSARTYRLEIERALRRIAERYQVAREGRWCEDRRSLILAYVAGIAGPRKVVEARMHLQACPGCAHMAAELRQAAEKVAAVTPMPDLALGDGALHRVVDALALTRDQLADLSGQAKQQALGLVTRADPASSGNYLAGTRPGAMAAAVASCVAIGGGAATYCAVEGFPEPVRDLVHADERPADGEAKRPERPEPKPETEPQPVAPSPPESRPEPQAPPPDPTPQQVEAPAPVAAAQREFGFEQTGSPPPSAASGGGEFGGGGGPALSGSGGGEFGP